MIVRYYQMPDGTLGKLSSMPAPDLPFESTEITQAQYESILQDAKDAIAQKIQDDVVANAAAALEHETQAADDYAALVAAGIPTETASRLTGHQA
jgi:hypothetical protein